MSQARDAAEAARAALVAAEDAVTAAKAAVAANPSDDNRRALRGALATVREARWVARGGLDNAYGATTYADFMAAARAARKGR